MNILGIGVGELILILLITLLVVGPERLPDLARQTGRMLVRLRNWFRGSPDAALVLRMRQEIEQELALLRNELIEVQSVRDEMLDAAKQINETINQDVIAEAREGIRDLQTVSRGKPITPAKNPAQQQKATPAVSEAEPATAQGAEQIAPPTAPAEPAAPAAAPARSTRTATPATTPAGAVLFDSAEFEQISTRIQAVMSDLWALQEELKQRGWLDEQWQPPSLELPILELETIAAHGSSTNGARHSNGSASHNTTASRSTNGEHDGAVTNPPTDPVPGD